MSSIERMQAALLVVLEEKRKDIERQAEGFVKALKQEIAELKRSDTELEMLLHSEDHLHLLQVSSLYLLREHVACVMSPEQRTWIFFVWFTVGLLNIIRLDVHR